MIKLSQKIIFLLLLSLFLIWHISLSAADDPAKDKSVKFSWESIDWAIKYRVEIKNINDTAVLEKEVDTNAIEFSLPPGRYKIRIGAINKFDKFAGWSDWAESEIMEKKPEVSSVFNLGINLSVGVPYYRFLSSSNSPFQNSMTGIAGKISFNFGNFIFFRPSDTLKYRGILGYFGLDIEGGYMNFQGKEIPEKIKIDKKEATYGTGLYLRTNFDFPVNMIVRGGVGLARAKFTYYTKNLSNNNLVLTSNDPYYKGGLSLEISVFEDFIIESGADYMVISYINGNLKEIRYFVMAGVRL